MAGYVGLSNPVSVFDFTEITDEIAALTESLAVSPSETIITTDVPEIINKFVISPNDEEVTGTVIILEHGTLMIAETATPIMAFGPNSYIAANKTIESESEDIFYGSLEIVPDINVTVNGILHGVEFNPADVALINT
jgi:hypothetical protein